MRILSQIFLLGLLLLGNGCKKNNNDDELPPLTFEGKNTIGCKINGEPWLPKGSSSGGIIVYPTKGGYYAVFNSPLIHIWIQTNNPSGYIDLFVKNTDSYNHIRPGKYYFNKNTESLPFGSGEKRSYGKYWVNNKEYTTDSLHNGWIDIIKSDSVNKIISGRFEFDAYNPSDGRVYIITDGRFDYKNH